MLMAFGEYCIESRHDSFRLKLTVLGKVSCLEYTRGECIQQVVELQIRDWWLGLSGPEKAEKARNKLRNMQLDTAGQPFPK